jgi:hypothetical protein
VKLKRNLKFTKEIKKKSYNKKQEDQINYQNKIREKHEVSEWTTCFTRQTQIKINK